MKGVGWIVGFKADCVTLVGVQGVGVYRVLQYLAVRVYRVLHTVVSAW